MWFMTHLPYTKWVLFYYLFLMTGEENMQNVKTVIRTQTVTIVNNEDLVVPANESELVITGNDLNVGEYGYGIILITAGDETATATLDVKYEVKDTNGNYYKHTSATQVTSKGSSSKTIANLDGETGRIVVTLGDAAADAFDNVTVEFVMKSR